MSEMWPPVRWVWIAVAIAGGIVASRWCGAFAMATAVWWSAAALVALVGRARRETWLAIAMLVGAGAAARERGEAPAIEGVDDRTKDEIEGVVDGPLIETPRATYAVVEWRARVVIAMEPAIAEGVAPGDRVRVRGRLKTPRGYRNPGGVDRRQVVRSRGGELEMRVDEIEVIGREVTPWRWAARAHRWASRRIAERGGDPAGNAIVRGAVIGDRSAVTEATDEAWRAAGIYHALSVSGMHLAVVAMLLFAGVRRAAAAVPAIVGRIDPGRLAAAVAAPAAIAYTFVTGGQTATLRALVVVMALLLGVVVRRRLMVIDAVGLAAALILVERPSAIADPSFQLSFAAALTLCIVGRGRGRWMRRALRTSIAVTLTTAPITAWHFHQISVGGVVGNLALAPLVELFVIPVGLAGLVVGGPVLDAAIAVAGVVDRGARLLGAICPVIDVPPPRALEIVAWYVALAAFWWRPRRPLVIVLALAVGAASAGWPRTRDDVRVTFVDVGQGDAAVIEVPGGEVWLVDAGPDTGDALLRFLRARRISHVDVAVISHPHPDHYDGLRALAGHIAIDELWIARPARAAPDFDAMVERLGARVVHPPLGVARRAGGATLEVLGPTYDDGGGRAPVAAADPVRSVNDDSLVLALTFAGRRVLFTGDIEREGEDALVAAGAFADVVKVPHHGSATSSSPALVAATHARIAVISCGRANRFGFPDPAVVARWLAVGAAVLRTDLGGAITVEIQASGALRARSHDEK